MGWLVLSRMGCSLSVGTAPLSQTDEHPVRSPWKDSRAFAEPGARALHFRPRCTTPPLGLAVPASPSPEDLTSCRSRTSASSATRCCAPPPPRSSTSTSSCGVLVKDLEDTMLDAPGAGLAAPQIGVGLRVFTYWVDGVLGHLVNPVPRPLRRRAGRPRGLPVHPGSGVRHQARPVGRGQGAEHARRARRRSRAPSCSPRCVQHETDHLDGILFVDRLDPEARREAMRAIREAEWFAGRPARGADQPALHLRPGDVSESRLRRHPRGGGARASMPSRPRATSSSASSRGPTRRRAAAGVSRPRRSGAAPRSSACRC